MRSTIFGKKSTLLVSILLKRVVFDKIEKSTLLKRVVFERSKRVQAGLGMSENCGIILLFAQFRSD